MIHLINFCSNKKLATAPYDVSACMHELGDDLSDSVFHSLRVAAHSLLAMLKTIKAKHLHNSKLWEKQIKFHQRQRHKFVLQYKFYF